MPTKPEVLKTQTVARSRLFEVQARVIAALLLWKHLRPPEAAAR